MDAVELAVADGDREAATRSWPRVEGLGFRI